jgi:predicted hydrocarbon binding protein
LRTKAQGLVSTIKWIEATHGRAALDEVLAGCSAPVRARCASVLAIEWVPVAEVVEFVGAADRLLSTGTGKLAEAAGEVGAREGIRSPFLRAAFYLAKPEFLMRRAASVWSQYCDQGEMHAHTFDGRTATFEVTGADETHAIFCALLTGWIREIARATGVANPSVRHAECRARGEDRCFWELRWSAIDG